MFGGRFPVSLGSGLYMIESPRDVPRGDGGLYE